MKAGCTAYDTIEEVHSTPLKELHRTSGCVVELHWQDEQTIDLLFVLAICFAIHNDKWAKRYTLQCFNCYFLSWAIIVITMRKSAVCGDGLNMAVQDGIRQGGNHVAWDVTSSVARWGWQWKRERTQKQGQDLDLDSQKRELALEREIEQERDLKRDLEQVQLECGPGQELELTAVRVQELMLVLDRVRLHWEWRRRLMQVLVPDREVEQEVLQVLGKILELELARALEQRQELLRWHLPQQPKERMRMRELARSLVLEPEAERERRRKLGIRLHRLKRLRVQERERVVKLLQERVLGGLGQIPLVLEWALALDWNLGAGGKNDTVILLDRLAKTNSYR
jgi:hypothetical protein